MGPAGEKSAASTTHTTCGVPPAGGAAPKSTTPRKAPGAVFGRKTSKLDAFDVRGKFGPAVPPAVQSVLPASATPASVVRAPPRNCVPTGFPAASTSETYADAPVPVGLGRHPDGTAANAGRAAATSYSEMVPMYPPAYALPLASTCTP